MLKKTEISIVVPVLNEELSVKDFHRDIVVACNSLGRSYEIIFVNDGSTDKTLDVLKTLNPITIISFRRNFGQSSALDAGIKHAKGDYIITLDGDNQNVPSDIPRLIEKLESEDLDVVSGWRVDRHDSFTKKVSSKIANFVRRQFLNDGIHDTGCTLKVYRRECFEHIDLYGEMHRFIPVLLKIKGFKIGELPVLHNPRTTGVTKYNGWSRSVKATIDMFGVWFFKKYSNRPLHVFGTMGFFFVVLSILFSIFLVYDKIFYGTDMSSSGFAEITFFSLLIGLQFFISGLMADMAVKNFYASNKERPYSIKEILISKNERPRKKT